MSPHATDTSPLDSARRLAPELIALRRELHQQPEIGLHLPNTQARVLAWLDGLGYEITTGESLSSITAVLRGAHPDRPATDAPSVLLRADMDALPLQEKNGLPYASRVDGAMHACGHDLHTSMLAGAARLLAERRELLAGDVVLMFQPGEEGYDGASHMIREGVLEAAGSRVHAAFGMHVMSNMGTAGEFFAKPGAVLSASTSMDVTLTGPGGHGAIPHGAPDPIAASAHIITGIQALIARRFDAFDPVIVTVGLIRGGTIRNIIPDTAHFEATVRSYSRTALDRIRELVPELIHHTAAIYGVTAEIEIEERYPVTSNDADEYAFAAEVARGMLGDQRMRAMTVPVTASEDFSHVLNEVPGAFLMLSAVPADRDAADAAPNHSPFALFDDSVLADGAALYAQLAISRLAASAAD